MYLLYEKPPKKKANSPNAQCCFCLPARRRTGLFASPPYLLPVGPTATPPHRHMRVSCQWVRHCCNRCCGANANNYRQLHCTASPHRHTEEAGRGTRRIPGYQGTSNRVVGRQYRRCGRGHLYNTRVRRHYTLRGGVYEHGIATGACGSAVVAWSQRQIAATVRCCIAIATDHAYAHAHAPQHLGCGHLDFILYVQEPVCGARPSSGKLAVAGARALYLPVVAVPLC